MKRSLCALSVLLLAVLLLACAALAVPAPSPSLKEWGDPINPDHDCKIRLDGGVLSFDMPGSDHDYDPVRKRFNAPRLLRDIEGDFELQVRVRIDSQPSAQSTVKGQPSFVSAGFLLIYPETGRFICDRIEYGVMQQGVGLDGFAVAPMLAGPQLPHASRKGIGADGFAVMKNYYCKKRDSNRIWDRTLLEEQLHIWDRGWREWPLPKKTDYAYLRLKLWKNDFYFFISPDGEKWIRLIYCSGPPAKFKLGLAAYTTSTEPSRVRFDQLKLWRHKKGNK